MEIKRALIPIEELEEMETNISGDIITLGEKNPTIRVPNSTIDISFYQTKDTLSDPEVYNNFIRNVERRFRASKEYKLYKSYLMELGFDHCMIMGNIEASYEKNGKVDVELHHNILNLKDDCILICEHVLNTIGYISTIDLIQLLINEHFANRIPCCFLSTTAHEMFTNNPDAYIPPNMTFGKWWELLSNYRYGITYDIANKINRYIEKYQNEMPTTIQIIPQEQILNFAYYNEYGAPVSEYDFQPMSPAQLPY